MPEQEPRLELSLKEKERRWSLLRDKLKEAGLSALIVYGGTQLGVPVHYLARVWGTKMNTVIFPVEGEPILLIPGSTSLTGELLVEQGCWFGAENICKTANLTAGIAEKIISLKLHKSKIGIDSFIFWPVKDYQTFQELCPGVDLVESHRLFGEVRGPKSSEELALMEEAIRVSDLAHYTFLAHLKPGLTEVEVAGKANDILEDHGVGDRIILFHSRPEIVYPYMPGPTIIQESNPVTFSPEFTRKLGYGAQMIRAYWWEEPKGVYKKMFELCDEMRKMVMREFRPGLEIIQAGKMIENLVSEYGFECDKLGHAIGVAYGDAPYITSGPDQRDYMEWTILPGEVYEVHPMIRAKGGKPPFVMIGDMFFIGKEENRWMTTALPGLPEMIPQ
ncbi:M24 family metallopeptidase [Thermodesulfobacteriota bacterium]